MTKMTPTEALDALRQGGSALFVPGNGGMTVEHVVINRRMTAEENRRLAEYLAGQYPDVFAPQTVPTDHTYPAPGTRWPDADWG